MFRRSSACGWARGSSIGLRRKGRGSEIRGQVSAPCALGGAGFAPVSSAAADGTQGTGPLLIFQETRSFQGVPPPPQMAKFVCYMDLLGTL